MYNANPPINALPSSRKLLRSTLIAFVAAIAILVAVVLPAEYAIDPTGIGRALGLTDMGEIKGQLAEEAAIDAAMDAGIAAAGSPAAPEKAIRQPVEANVQQSGNGKPVQTTATQASEDFRNEEHVELAPGQGIEIKLAMNQGQRATFSWSVSGGVVNFDTHGDGGGRAISYEKGRAQISDSGVLVAAFDGNHGWFWRNRGDQPVTLTLRTGGQYSELKK